MRDFFEALLEVIKEGLQNTAPDQLEFIERFYIATELGPL